ncbi:MAG: ATP-dependent DNA helicase RecG [Candidatus Taylorbacteria bacterium]|nr:ATP-dependent DNA helicase RecG [Candidatus Taylorbacteria bacterium]
MTFETPLQDIVRTTEVQKKALARLGIITIRDILYHFPVRYGNTSETQNIASLTKSIPAVIFGKISSLKTSKGFRSKIPMSTATITDDSGSIKVVWFNQPYIAKMIADNSLVRIEGKVSQRRPKARTSTNETEDVVEAPQGELYFSNPKIEKVDTVPIGVGASLFGDQSIEHTLYPVYPETKGITSNWLYHALQRVLKTGVLETLTDPIPDDILKKYNLPSITTAFIWIHTPLKESDALAARKRFAFEEVFFIQLEKQRARAEYQQTKAFIITPDQKHVDDFIKRFPFDATDAQRKAIHTIVADFKKGYAMSRLLEGDVGSGKTAVAAATVHSVATTRPKGQNFGSLQTAYMCPTEILATQHFESFIQYFSYLGINIGLMTGSGCRKFPSKINPKGWTNISRAQLLKWVANGEIPILIGTHALIQKTVKFKNLAYVIIDEQHRFGTAQRAKLVRKDTDGQTRAPHLLSMTATPIPRTLALTVYGDLDLTLLDVMPHGRKPIITEIVAPNTDRKEVYEKVRAQLREGRQAYIICPRIDEPDPDKELRVEARSVTEEAKRLKKEVFKEYEIGILHSKMTPAEKDKAMMAFKNGKTHILCATSVVEVGVNVPNANTIIIEGGERFGLAQLHQLRGRVIRGNHQPYCFVFAESMSDKTRDRLTALKTAKNGFELAEYDLQFRGAGVLYSGKQWGISDVAMEALKNIKMVEAARFEATTIIESEKTPDSALALFPFIKAELARRANDQIHFE